MSDERSHLYRVIYGDLSFCGCGVPEAGLEIVRNFLRAADQQQPLTDIVPDHGVRHIVLSVMSSADLIEHGSSIDYSWLHPKGEWLLAQLEQWPDLNALINDLSEVGFPHDGDDSACTAACWSVPMLR